MAFHECRQEDRLGETLSMSVSAPWRDAGGEAGECETMDWVKNSLLIQKLLLTGEYFKHYCCEGRKLRNIAREGGGEM